MLTQNALLFWPQALKEEIRNENQDKRKIFDPSGI